MIPINSSHPFLHVPAALGVVGLLLLACNLLVPGRPTRPTACCGGAPQVITAAGDIEERMFSPVGGNIVDLTFFVPGTQTPALVRGFGAVYLDVDTEPTAFEYFDAAGNSLGSYGVPEANNEVSLLGVAFSSPVVSRVKVACGTVALGPDDSAENDVAVMDDFIFGEPQAANP